MSKVYPKIMFPTAKLSKYEDGVYAIIIKMSFDRELIEIVKTIPNRAYFKEKNFWHCPASTEAIEILIKNKFKCDELLLKYYEKSKFSIDSLQPIDPPGLKKELRNYQKIGVAFGSKLNLRFFLADDMGAGKTAQVMGLLQLHKQLRPAIVITTATLKYNWEAEINDWMTETNCTVLTGQSKKELNPDISLLNFDIIANDTKKVYDKNGNHIADEEIKYTGWIDYILDAKPKILIVDECHKIKNDTAIRTKAIMKLAKHIPHIIMISGTPIEQKPDEIFNPIKAINPFLFKSRWHFRMRYCDPKHNGFGWNFNGHSNDDELHQKLQTCMIRRLKKDILTELPDKSYRFVPVEIDNQKEYESAEKFFLQYITKKAEIQFEEDYKTVNQKMLLELKEFKAKYNLPEVDFEEVLNLQDQKELYVGNEKKKVKRAREIMRMGVLKQLAVKGKLKSIVSWISDFLESDEKLVVFAINEFVVDEILRNFPKISTKIDGRTKPKDRIENVKAFQNNPKIKLIVISEAAAEGITLTAACNIAICQLPWHPKKLDQIIDRIHRISQLRKVFVHYLLARNTIEERIAHINDEKRKVIDKIIDNKETEIDQLITEVISQYK